MFKLPLLALFPPRGVRLLLRRLLVVFGVRRCWPYGDILAPPLPLPLPLPLPPRKATLRPALVAA